MSALFLSVDELRELTGYKYAKGQTKWLRAQGWQFVEDAAGRPKVLRAHMEAKMGGASRRPARAEPNSEALHR